MAAKMLSTEIGAHKRQHIIETAYKLFKRHGYHATGIDRIIAEANVAKMTMYRHFPGKDGLIVEVLQYRAKRFDAQLDRLAEKGATPEKKIRTIFDWYERWFQSDDFHGCLFQHALAEFGEPGHPVFEVAADQKNSFKRRLRRILEERMPGGRAESAAAALFMLFEGATLLAQMGRGKEAIRDARKAALGLMGVPAGSP
jgi:AcrR family transcriptional regulator